ncbi:MULTISPECIES: phosphate ABC transporter permease PstA [Pseudanabaena]|uniref:Phosphate transport system permease protein PstA n=2 Tax=Pseudanabaena TaxID=1152 RepID=L8N448_9CYAN|nr:MULTISPECIES: phosphate ABC transporter permease PstA [Pseudanabaena]ELS33854.1 phosphate ABC transporter membrane protein 2, PhoT family [Pseudanabaena biceps PCC 7429]MDG3493949.1 phosphate ABC transporter permease PstA [Pseudanabaena catenata USMAC16]
MTAEPQNLATPKIPMGNLVRDSSSPRNLFGNLMTGLTVSAAVIALLPLVAVLSYVIFKGASRIDLGVFTQLPPAPGLSGGGFGNAIVGTLVMVGIAALISVPFGLMAAIFVSEFGGKNQIVFWIRFATNVLSGVPSIVVGVFTYGIVVIKGGLSLGLGFSAVAGGIALSVLMLPIIVRTSEESLKLVPDEIRQAAVGVGATKFQTVFFVVLPAALPAIVTGAMLAVARAAGETAPLIFTALFSQYWANGVLEKTASLGVLVYNFSIVPGGPQFINQQQLAWAGALVLVVMILITSILSRLATGKRTY